MSARSAGVKHSFGEQVIEHGLSAKIIMSILTEWPFHRLTKKRLSKHGTGGMVMEWISVNTDIDWFAEYDYCGCKWECLPEPPREDV